MWPLDVSHVPVLKQGQGTVASIGESELYVLAPAHLLALIHRGANPLGSAPAFADCTADPVVGFCEGLCRLDEVQHGVVHPGARR